MNNPSPFETLSLNDIERHRQDLEARIQETASKILDLVAKDVPRYLERETRTRWLDHPDFALAMDDARLGELKAAIGALATQSTGEVRSDLSALDPWLTDTEPESRKGLVGNKSVWTSLQKIACKLSGLMAKHDFPADTDAPEGITYALVYKTPVYFIGGEYCPGHIETYWKLAEEHRQVVEAIDAHKATESRKTLEARWNSAQ